VSFAWADYLALAQTLASPPTDEARLRTAISRAYYAAFNVAKGYLAGTRPHLTIPATGQAHEFVWNELTTKGTPAEALVGRRGIDLKRRRTMADYRLQWSMGVQVSKETTAALADARRIVTELKAPGS
jgi:hypothetical protein